MRKKTVSKREQILQAAFETVCRQGYYETRMDDVARRARVAKGTVYLYFHNKPDLYLGIVRWLIGQAVAVVKQFMDQPLPAQTRLARIFETWVENLKPYPGAIELIFPEMNRARCHLTLRFHKQVMSEVRLLIDPLAEIVALGIKKGEFRQINPKLAALNFINAFRSGLLLMSGALPINSAPQQSLNLFFYGISKTKREDE